MDRRKFFMVEDPISNLFKRGLTAANNLVKVAALVPSLILDGLDGKSIKEVEIGLRNEGEFDKESNPFETVLDSELASELVRRLKNEKQLVPAKLGKRYNAVITALEDEILRPPE